MIEAYSFGKIVVDGKTYTSDVIIYPDKVEDSWWRKKGHLLEKNDVEDVTLCEPEVLIIGTGAHGLMKITDEAKQFLKSNGIKLVAEETEKACKTYNKLRGKRKVVAMLHLTC
ncbi:MAG TPA: hypothetical protein EYP23_03280 [Thermoplasmata archaeon]|nr:hypothetical protein [Thermoplasmata archaeon]